MAKVNLIGKIEKKFFPPFYCSSHPISTIVLTMAIVSVMIEQFAAQLMYPIEQWVCTNMKDTEFSNECIQFELDLAKTNQFNWERQNEKTQSKCYHLTYLCSCFDWLTFYKTGFKIHLMTVNIIFISTKSNQKRLTRLNGCISFCCFFFLLLIFLSSI